MKKMLAVLLGMMTMVGTPALAKGKPDESRCNAAIVKVPRKQSKEFVLEQKDVQQACTAFTSESIYGRYVCMEDNRTPTRSPSYCAPMETK